MKFQAFPYQVHWDQVLTGPIQGPNERCIEMPLATGLLGAWTPGRILDAGCAYNCIMPVPPVAEIVHLTQNITTEHQYAQPGRTYVNGDLRDLSAYADGSFDRVGCISTLEHVGMDNGGYGGSVESDPASVLRAQDELWRVCRDLLLITVPFGQTPTKETRWRAFTPETLHHVTVPGAEIRYYWKTPRGWVGGGPTPNPDPPMAGQKVDQIACLVARR